MTCYDFDSVIDRTGTFCTQWDYVRDRFGTDGLLPFTISDMDFAVSDKIYEAVTKRVSHPVYGYSRWRNEEYLGAIVRWYGHRFACEVRESSIYYSPSVMYSVAKMIQMLCEPGDGVTMFTPGYDSFFSVIRNNERRIAECELTNDRGRYVIDFERLGAALTESKVLLLCNPHNPTGRVWTKEELNKIIELAERYGVAIISDDIHMDIAYGRRTTPVLALDASVPIVVCSSPSKSFNTPSLGGSYVIIPDGELGERFERMTRYTEYLNSPSILGVVSTIAAYESEGWLEELLAYLEGNLRFSINYISREMPLMDVSMPEGCYFLWTGFSRMGVGDKDMQQALIEQGHVAIMPGTTYGASCYLRFHVGCPRSKVERGLAGMKRAYDTLISC